MLSRSRLNVAHTRQSRPDSSLGLQEEVSKPLDVVLIWLSTVNFVGNLSISQLPVAARKSFEPDQGCALFARQRTLVGSKEETVVQGRTLITWYRVIRRESSAGLPRS